MCSSKIIHSKAILFQHEKERKSDFVAIFFLMDSSLADVNVYIWLHKRCTLSHAISLNGKYCLFTCSDISYRFNGENDNIVLECGFKSQFDHLQNLSPSQWRRFQ